MNRRIIFACGMIAPVLFIAITVFGGAIRPGYSHLSNTISELFSPGSPNKALLDPLHTLYAVLLVLFGVGLFQFFKKVGKSKRIGLFGASLYITMGLLSLTSATVFPQDAWGSPQTFPGRMHMVVHGAISIVSILFMLLIGIWFRRTRISPGFWTYTLITFGVVIVSAGLFIANFGSPMMGLTERVAGFVGLQWTFVLALKLFKNKQFSSV